MAEGKLSPEDQYIRSLHQQVDTRCSKEIADLKACLREPFNNAPDTPLPERILFYGNTLKQLAQVTAKYNYPIDLTLLEDDLREPHDATFTKTLVTSAKFQNAVLERTDYSKYPVFGKAQLIRIVEEVLEESN